LLKLSSQAHHISGLSESKPHAGRGAIRLIR
jgi:hypothetical protein